MITPVLILHGKLSVAISLKQAIERNARYEVHPFTTPDAAVDFLREHPQDVVLVDTASLDSLPEHLIPTLREAQPDVMIVVAPRPEDWIIQSFGINATVEANYRAPQVIQAIESLLSSTSRPSRPAQDAGKTGMLEHIFDDSPPPAPSTLPEHGTLEDVLQQMGHDDFGFGVAQDEMDEATPHDPQSQGAEFRSVLDTISPSDAQPNARTDFDALVDSLRRDQPPPTRSRMSDFIIRGGIDALLQDLDESGTASSQNLKRDKYSHDSLRVYDKLAREEPPMPGFEDAGTVSDLVSGVHDKGFQRVLSILRGDEIQEESSDGIDAADANFDFETDDSSSRSSVIDVPRRPGEDYDFDGVPAAEDSRAHVVLQQTLEQALNVDDFSIEDLLNRIERQIPGSIPLIKPLPAHVREDAERRWREARQVGEMQGEIEDDAPEDVPEGFFSDQTTRASKAQRFETHPELMETEWFDSPNLPGRVREDTIAYTQAHQPVSEKDTPPPPPSTTPESVAERKPSFSPELEFTEESGSYIPDSQTPDFVLPEYDEEVPDDSGTPDFELPEYNDEPSIRATIDIKPVFVEPELPVSLPKAVPATLSETQPDTLPGGYDESWDDNQVEYAAEEDYAAPEEAEPYPYAAAHEVAAHEAAAYEVSPFLQLETGEDSDWIDLHTEDFNTQFELMAAFELALPAGQQTTGALYTEMPVESPQIDRAAQLALQLTEFSLETTAEAALLIRDGEIVGRAGRMPREELGSLEPAILAAWNAGRRDARVQFVNQQETGRDYLLYACRTEEDLLLTLIFKGSTSMGDIRRQGNQLVKALMSVPEDLPVPVRVVTPPPKPAAIDPGPREPFAYVWLLRDPESFIDSPVAQAISSGMQMQLGERAWRIHDLQVSEDYVYLYAEVPGDEPAFRIVRDLKRRSAEIARVQNSAIQADNLWADSYLIVTPGRPLDVEEIQQFINFERM